MPKFKRVNVLKDLAVKETAKVVHKAFLHLDSNWKPPTTTTPLSSPRTSPLSSPVGRLSCKGILPSEDPHEAEVQIIRRWLLQLPIMLVEDVVSDVIEKIEAHIHDDKDCKLILTLINIEKSKPSDFFFGVHSLFETLAETSISRLKITTRMWFALWEYEQLTINSYIHSCLSVSLPSMTSLTHLNIAYMASDKLLYQLAKFCRSLEDLCVDHSNNISDRGIRFLSGWPSSSTASPSEPLEPSSFLSPPSSSTSDRPEQEQRSSPVHQVTTNAGCKMLRFLSVQGCSSVTEKAICYLLLHNRNLEILKYHQSCSVAEIIVNVLCKKREVTDQQQRAKELALVSFDHPFPYGLNLPDAVVERVPKICPKIRVLNLVSSDDSLAAFACFGQLTKATIELEDAFGMGLLKFLQVVGHQLKELTISCGSDADSTFLDGGGRAFQLFNVGLRLARRHCPQLTVLNISGCGLVTNELLKHIEDNPDDFNVPTSCMTSLKTLILLTYYDADETPIQTCEEKLLQQILKGTKPFGQHNNERVSNLCFCRFERHRVLVARGQFLAVLDRRLFHQRDEV